MPDGDWPAPVEVVNPDGLSDVVLLCEHASNHIPAAYGALGLSPPDLVRHIAVDIGAADLTRALSARLDAPAFCGTTSRLLVDLNRPFDAPTAMPQVSEATVIPGNLAIGDAERRRRYERIFRPYHETVAAALDDRRRTGRRTLLVTVHSFTPVFLGVSRPWHAGVLFDTAADFAGAVLAELAAEGLVVAPNQPYTVDRASDYAVPVYGTDRGLPAILLEIRNDLLSDADRIDAWADRLDRALRCASSQLSSRS